jgi:uncharacterized protein YeaC (DUF1315 family)
MCRNMQDSIGVNSEEANLKRNCLEMVMSWQLKVDDVDN